MNNNGGTYWNSFHCVTWSMKNQKAATAHKIASTPPGELIRASDMVLTRADDLCGSISKIARLISSHFERTWSINATLHRSKCGYYHWQADWGTDSSATSV